MTFFVKSAISMAVLYCFYHFTLRNQKILLFNRFYLMFSLVYSFLIPFIDIPLDPRLPLNSTFNAITTGTVNLILRESATGIRSSHLNFQIILLLLFITISAFLLIRFVSNIFSIIRKIQRNKKVKYNKVSLVLVEEMIIPHSFFRYIFLNRSDFENGKIEKELLMHEETHCRQYHSVDVILIQLLTIVFWFNPLIWLYKRSMLLNHEFYADDKALEGKDVADYHQILFRIITHDSSGILVSSFKNSFIKNRIDMMKKSYPINKAVLRKLTALSLTIILAIFLSCRKETHLTVTNLNFENEWWSPIIKKHGMTPHGFNNFEKVFEMGTSNSITNGIVTLENAVFLLKPTGDKYSIIISAKACHDLDNNTIEAEEGTIKTYSLNAKEIVPLSELTFDHLKYQVDNGRAVANNVKGKVNISH